MSSSGYLCLIALFVQHEGQNISGAHIIINDKDAFFPVQPVFSWSLSFIWGIAGQY
jgi:hypothetical protein